MTKTNSASQSLSTRRAQAALAGYALVPVHPVLAARESANCQRGERARKLGGAR